MIVLLNYFSNSTTAAMDGMDLSSIPFFTEFSNIKSNFVHLIAMLDSSDVPTVNLLSLLSAHNEYFKDITIFIQRLRPYIPLFADLLTESPMRRPGTDGDIDQIVPYESVVRQLNEDTLASYGILDIHMFTLVIVYKGQHSV